LDGLSKNKLTIAALLAVNLAWPAYANTCEFSRTELYTGEDHDIILCTSELLTNVSISASDPSALNVVYSQPLQSCGVGDKRSGYQIVVNPPAQDNDTRAELQIANVETGEIYCVADLSILPARTIETPTWLNAMPIDDARYVDVDGIKTRYFEKGSGPAIVLVHGGHAGGANNSAQKWEQNFDALAQHYRVIALDRLAQAGTDNLPTAEDYESYFLKDAQHLEAFVTALDLKQVTLVGHSQGGWPVTWLALQRPDLVECLVNVDTVMVPEDMELMREALAFMIYVSRFANPATGPTVPSTRRSMALRYPSGNNITAAKAQRVVDQFGSAKTAAAREQMSALRMNPLHPSFKALKQQAFDAIKAGNLQTRSLVIWGEKDPQNPLGLGRQFNDMLSAANVDTKLAVIEGAGHAPFVEFPDKFNELVVNYCSVSNK